MTTLADQVRAWAVQHGIDPAEAIEDWSERAAIREFLGGLTRDEAERKAFDDVRAMRA